MIKARNLVYNIAQFLFILHRKLFNVLEWGRGTGKSTILARQIIDCVQQMPRSSGVMVAATYAQILTRTLPSTIAGLEQHGFIKDVHYFVGRRPPKTWKWKEPYEPPLDYKRCIIFYNGTVLNFVSQDNSAGSGRGMNNDWVVADEAALLNESKFETDILLTNRGNLKRVAHYPDGTHKYFSQCPLHHSVFLASSTPVTSSGQWFLKYEKEAKRKPKKYLFLRASAEVNRHNLGDDYFEMAESTMPDWLYKAEVLNHRMNKIENSFYPLLDEDIHTYQAYDYSNIESINDSMSNDSTMDGDVLKDQPLDMSIDWGSNLNCLVVGQEHNNEFKFLKNLYVYAPSIIDDLINDFCDYYEHHPTKIVKMWYDPSGNVSVANSRLTFAEQAAKIIRKRGWIVYVMTEGLSNDLHHEKHNLWNQLLKENKQTLPKIRFNKSNCHELIVSMSNAPTKRGVTEAIKKDKKSEKNKKINQAYATHLSDAADILMVGKYQNFVVVQEDVPSTRTL